VINIRRISFLTSLNQTSPSKGRNWAPPRPTLPKGWCSLSSSGQNSSEHEFLSILCQATSAYVFWRIFFETFVEYAILVSVLINCEIERTEFTFPITSRFWLISRRGRTISRWLGIHERWTPCSWYHNIHFWAFYRIRAEQHEYLPEWHIPIVTNSWWWLHARHDHHQPATLQDLTPMMMSVIA
jgi:hypothetical protein